MSMKFAFRRPDTDGMRITAGQLEQGLIIRKSLVFSVFTTLVFISSFGVAQAYE
jgi:hypothetical protein